jgi:tetratricopeptide (TPR) repeat protein
MSESLQEERIKRAGTLIRSGRSADAIPLLDAVVESSACAPWVLAERGRAKQLIGDLEGAIADFTLLAARWPENTDGLTQRANARRLLGDLHGSIDDYSSAIRINEQHGFAYLHRGRVKMQRGDLAGAVADFSADMIHSKEGRLSGLLNRGVAKHQMKDFSGAIEDLTAALEIEMPPPVYSPLFRARVRASLGDWRSAIADYSLALNGFPGLTNALRERSEAKRAIGDGQGAATDIIEYQRLGGRDLPAYRWEEGPSRE